MKKSRGIALFLMASVGGIGVVSCFLNLVIGGSLARDHHLVQRLLDCFLGLIDCANARDV